MWVTTTRGFFSAVQHRDDADLLVIRTRVRADADNLEAFYQDFLDETAQAAWPDQNLPAWPTPEVITYPASDYPWRVIMPRKAWAALLEDVVQDLDYGNFKDAVKAEQGKDRADTYTTVWAALLRLEDQDPQGRPRIPWGEGLDDEDWAEYDAWATRTEKCPECGGEGSIVIGPYDPIAGEDREPCPTCDGTGLAESEPADPDPFPFDAYADAPQDPSPAQVTAFLDEQDKRAEDWSE